jgi:hypothetical protein
MAALGRLDLVRQLSHPYPPLPGSASEHSSAVALHLDPHDGSLWADGYDVRRTLREITEPEAEALQGLRATDS